jgi:predicted dinucleotide-binding enzyme
VSTSVESPTAIAVLGAGMVGRTLATGWARTGHRVILGSRHPDSSGMDDAVTAIRAAAGGDVTAATHRGAARAADVVLITVPGDQVPSLIDDLGSALAGRTVVDATNNMSGAGVPLNAVDGLRATGATVFRAFNTVGWEQMHDPTFGELRADMPYAGPTGMHLTIVQRLIGDIGFRPIHLGDTPEALAAVDALARVWFLMAFRQGYGRRLGLRFLTQDDDPPAR